MSISDWTPVEDSGLTYELIINPDTAQAGVGTVENSVVSLVREGTEQQVGYIYTFAVDNSNNPDVKIVGFRLTSLEFAASTGAAFSVDVVAGNSTPDLSNTYTNQSFTPSVEFQPSPIVLNTEGKQFFYYNLNVGLLQVPSTTRFLVEVKVQTPDSGFVYDKTADQGTVDPAIWKTLQTLPGIVFDPSSYQEGADPRANLTMSIVGDSIKLTGTVTNTETSGGLTEFYAVLSTSSPVDEVFLRQYRVSVAETSTLLGGSEPFTRMDVQLLTPGGDWENNGAVPLVRYSNSSNTWIVQGEDPTGVYATSTTGQTIIAFGFRVTNYFTSGGPVDVDITFTPTFKLVGGVPPEPPTGTGKNYVYELEKGFSFDGNYIPHFIEFNWFFGESPVQNHTIQKIRLHGLTKGNALLQVQCNGLETKYNEDGFQQPQYIDMLSEFKYVSSEFTPVTSYTDYSARGLAIQMKFSGRNLNITKPEPSHVLQVLVTQSSPYGATSN